MAFVPFALMLSGQKDREMETMSVIEAFTSYLESRIAPGWHVVRSEIMNDSTKPLELIAEPYGASVIIAPNGKCEIVAEEPDAFAIRMSFSDSYIQVWANGIIELFEDGEALGTTSEFMEWHREWQEQAQ